MNTPIFKAEKAEMGEILRGYPFETLSLSSHQLRTLRALRDCRTAALGGHIDACDACGNIKISYNSCRNRHCPKCQGVEKEMWMLAREEELLPVTYFHVVFTIPHELNDLCRYAPETLYALLFDSAWQTLNQFGWDNRWLGAQIGATMILHTWGQNLSLHPHVHCIVPSGGLGKDGKWQHPKKGNEKFLFPVNALKSVFKALFLRELNRIQKAFLLNDKKTVTFDYKDYKTGGEKKQMTLTTAEFIRRFAQHILPPRFRRIRHYGFLSNAAKTKSLEKARQSLKVQSRQRMDKAQRREAARQRLLGQNVNRCPCCKEGTMRRIGILPPTRAPPTAGHDLQNVIWIE